MGSFAPIIKEFCNIFLWLSFNLFLILIMTHLNPLQSDISFLHGLWQQENLEDRIYFWLTEELKDSLMLYGSLMYDMVIPSFYASLALLSISDKETRHWFDNF